MPYTNLEQAYVTGAIQTPFSFAGKLTPYIPASSDVNPTLGNFSNPSCANKNVSL